MRIDYTQTALDDVADAPASVRRAFWKKMKLLEANLLHPNCFTNGLPSPPRVQQYTRYGVSAGF
jgi:hypothetical protein